MPTLVIADDDPGVTDLVRRAFAPSGFGVVVLTDSSAVLSVLLDDPPDIAVIDAALPGVDGFELCTRLRRENSRTPVLLLTKDEAVEARVRALDAGADDCLGKPFEARELVARVEALLRRPVVRDGTDRLAFGDLVFDPASRDARRGQRDIVLTRTESLLLELLLRNPRQVLPRSLILERVWGHGFEDRSNSLEVLVANVRRKLELGGEPRVIQTVRGVGYALRESSPSRSPCR